MDLLSIFPFQVSPTSHPLQPPFTHHTLIFHTRRRLPRVLDSWPDSSSATPTQTPFHRTGIGTNLSTSLCSTNSKATGLFTRPLRLRSPPYLLPPLLRSDMAKPYNSIFRGGSMGFVAGYPGFIHLGRTSFRRSRTPPPPRGLLLDQKFVMSLPSQVLVPSPFTASTIAPKLNPLHRKIIGSNRRLRKTSLLGLIVPPLAFPPDPHLPLLLSDDTRLPVSGSFRHLMPLHIRPPDQPMSQTPSHTGWELGQNSRAHGLSPAVVAARLPRRNKRMNSAGFGTDARTKVRRNLRSESVDADGRRCRCEDSSFIGQVGGKSQEVCSCGLVGEKSKEDFQLQCNKSRKGFLSNLPGFIFHMGLVFLILWVVGLGASCAPWLVLNFVVPASVSNTPVITIEWLEDRDKYFADDCVHRFKLRASSAATSILYPYSVPRLGHVISLLRRFIGQPRHHVHSSAWRLHSVSTGFSRVKSLLSEKLGSSSAPSRRASPYGMFLRRRCTGGLVFGCVYHRRVLLYFTSTMWFLWSLRWSSCTFALIMAHARSTAPTYTPPPVLDLAPSAVHACRAGFLSADIPLLVNLQFATSRASLPFSGMFLSVCSFSIIVFYLSCIFISTVITFRLLSKLFRELGYPHLSRRTRMPSLYIVIVVFAFV